MIARRASQSEGLESLARARRPGNLERDVAPTGLDGEGETKEAATGLLVLDNAGDVGEQAGTGGETEPKTVRQIRNLVGALEETGQELLALRAELVGRKAARWAG